jgi:hypothetical protein
MSFPFLPLKANSSREPVVVTETHYKYFPASFIWRGQSFEVSAVRRCWTSVRRDLAGRSSEYHHFRVRITEGTFVLTRDLRRDRWMLEPDLDEGRAAA